MRVPRGRNRWCSSDPRVGRLIPSHPEGVGTCQRPWVPIQAHPAARPQGRALSRAAIRFGILEPGRS
eukprot:14072338-Alexandrium_andersonii.AAC.1